MQKKKSKYFIAIVPPSPLQEEIMKLKAYVSEHYASHAALRSPGHITLHMPFELEGAKEKRFLRDFAAYSSPVPAFTIRLNGFSAFEPRVIFINVAPCERLARLQEEAVELMKRNFHVFNQSDDLRGFHPHVTIAFRDLKKPAFYAAMKEFSARSFNASFICSAVSLLKHDGRQWNETGLKFTLQ